MESNARRYHLITPAKHPWQFPCHRGMTLKMHESQERINQIVPNWIPAESWDILWEAKDKEISNTDSTHSWNLAL